MRSYDVSNAGSEGAMRQRFLFQLADRGYVAVHGRGAVHIQMLAVPSGQIVRRFSCHLSAMSLGIS